MELSARHGSLLRAAEVPILSFASIDSLKLNSNKAFQLMAHSFGRMSAQPLVKTHKGTVNVNLTLEQGAVFNMNVPVPVEPF